MTGTSSFFITADELESRLGEPGLKVIDGSWYLPAQNRDARREYDAGHIAGAVFFDQDAVVEPGVDLPHALPSPDVFALHAGAMGIAASDTIVVHDGPGLFSAPRVWWLFRIMGARNAVILEGGLDGWKAQGRPVTTEPTRHAPNVFSPEPNTLAVVTFDDMRRIVESGDVQIADARPAGRFSGVDPEPRPGMRSGHMPGARNVPFSLLVENGKLRNDNDLRQIFEEQGIDLSKPVVTSCGSGVTAAVLTLALQTVGHRYNMLYDGSWSEWGAEHAGTPVVTGEE